MCRILAIKGKIGGENAMLILEEFRNLAEYGNTPVRSGRGHKDGWGYVAYKGGRLVLYEKNPQNAFADPLFRKTVERISRAGCGLIVGHLRKISTSGKSKENTHPFLWKNFSFCHNGTIFESGNIALSEQFKRLPKGKTDSEKYFARILQEISANGRNDSRTTKRSILASIKYINDNFDYTALNMAFSDGKSLWIAREVNAKNFFVKKKKLLSYYSLYVGKNKGYRIVSSEKLPLKNVRWTAIENHKLFKI
jgi:glutamine amidotransferase